jgi:hypothetical protein
MIDLDKATDKLEKADGFLTVLKKILKKHFGIIIILIVCAFAYWFWTIVNEELTKPIPLYEDEYYDEFGGSYE